MPRLGLTCVGRWSRELGFTVELSGSSAYGGTRAVMFVPFRLLTDPLPAPRRAPSVTAERAEPSAPPVPVRDDAPRVERHRPGRSAPAAQPTRRPPRRVPRAACGPRPADRRRALRTLDAGGRTRFDRSGVISGTLRGRAAVDADAEPSPPGGQPLPTTPHEHDGGRP